jgi:hypothetical protein
VRFRLGEARSLDPASEQLASAAWSSGTLRWSRVAVPGVAAALGVACVAYANSLAVTGVIGAQPLWWLGVLAIFAPAAAAILFTRLSRIESIWVLGLAAAALYAVKLVFAPGRFWEFDELLHVPTLDSILRTGHLFAPNTLLPVSPYYPGLEAVTASIARVTGLDIVNAGLILIGIAHVLTVMAIFLFIERVATPSRLAAAAALFYLTCPAFLYFDAQFAYESVGLPLSLACLFVLREAQLSRGTQRFRLNVVGALFVLAVVVTHHVTSFILVTTLLVWTAFDLYFVLRVRRQNNQGLWFDAETGEALAYVDGIPGSGWVPALGVAAVLLWLVSVASITSNYLLPQLLSGIAQLIRIMRFEELGRNLFQSNGGQRSPLLEMGIGLISVLIIIPLIPIGMRYAWRQRQNRALSRMLAIGAIIYPAALALRLSRAGWEIGSRATAFIYVPLAFVLAAAVALLASPRAKHPWLRTTAMSVATLLIFAGGVIAVTSSFTRQPAPYNPGRAWAPYDAESIAAADWAANVLGPGHRIMGDSAGGTLMGSFGRQVLVPSGGGISVSNFFLSPGFDIPEQSTVLEGEIEYVFVDRRIADTVPVKGFFYEKWERDVRPYGSTISSATVNKFSVLRDANKVFDSGNAQFFELHRLTQ